MPVKGTTKVNKAIYAYRQQESSEKSTAPKKRVIYSNFFVTISTNYKTNGTRRDFDRFNDRFAQVLETMTSPEMIGQFFDFRYPRQFDRWEEPYIYSFDAETNIEEGNRRSQGGRMHAHMLLTVRHNSKISMSRKRVREYINQEMAVDGVKGSFVKINYIDGGGALARLLDYIRKQQHLPDHISKQLWEEASRIQWKAPETLHR
jgi:hypothetical protein